MAKRGKSIKIDTHPTKDVVVRGLTKDLSVEASIFDLIDNSIDAARNTIFKDTDPSSKPALPDSFAGFEIKLVFSGAGFKIEDNCGGIPVDALKDIALRFGARSNHELGIGVFGVGLNRALFKLGKVSHLKTDTGDERAELVLNTENYLNSADWELPAEVLTSTGKVGTEIEIRQLPVETARQFADREWVDGFRDEVGARYGRFIAKKLSILVNRVSATDNAPHIREDGPYEGEYKYYKTESGVSIHIQYGQHDLHRFTNEPGYDKERNSEITGEFGWNILCNDRAILVADKSWKTGWDTKFHSEFYGFVGYVTFVGDPAKLPWNTTKIDVDLNNDAYAMAIADMRRFAENWRALAEKRKRTASTPRPVPPKKSKPAASTKKTTKKPVTKKPVVKQDHNQFRTVLPTDISEQNCFDKHLALVHEGKLLDLGDHPYAGMALIRMLFETTVVTYFARHNTYQTLKDFAAARRKKKITLSDEDEKKLVPSMDEMLAFLENNPNVWGAAKQNYLKHSVQKMSTHQKALNSALHNAFQPINKSQAFQIRDEILPALRHMIES